MKDSAWYDFFLESLHRKYPKKLDLVQALMDLLFIEREAVYRRLRQDVTFSTYEVVKIATAWNISLDEITNRAANNVSFTMKAINYVDPSKEEMIEVQKRVQRLEHFETSPDAECMEVCNKLPRSLTAEFTALYQFDIFRWAYQYGNMEERPKFSQITFTEQFLQELENYAQTIKQVAVMNYIWDHKIFDHLIRDIQYFHSILLITDEEKKLIKKELLTLLDYLLEVANKGCFPETNKKVNIYISKVNIGTNYSYIYTEELKMCRVHVFEKFDLFSFNTEMINNFRAWMQLKKRTSIQISEVDEKSRIEFFRAQRQLAEEL